MGAELRDAGMQIEKLPGDEIGLKIGLAVDHDILGNPIVDAPDIGAIELSN